MYHTVLGAGGNNGHRRLDHKVHSSINNYGSHEENEKKKKRRKRKLVTIKFKNCGR